jgi:hypothetical protein
MSDPSSKKDAHPHPLEAVPEQDSTPPSPPSAPTDSAPVIFTDSFGPMGKDGQRATIALSKYPTPNDHRRPSEPIRRQSLIQFNTATAEDVIRRESVATGKMQSMEAKKMSVGERKPSERGRRMSSPPPKRYVNVPDSASITSPDTFGLTTTKII